MKIQFYIVASLLFLSAKVCHADDKHIEEFVTCGINDFEKRHIAIFSQKEPDKIVFQQGGIVGIGKQSYDVCAAQYSKIMSPNDLDEATDIFRGFVDTANIEFKTICKTPLCTTVFAEMKRLQAISSTHPRN